MGDVVDLNSFRKQKAELPENPFSHKAQVKGNIKGLLLDSVKHKSPSHLASISSVLDREKSVVKSLDLYEKALKLADSINCRIVRREKQNEIVFEIVDKG